MQERKKILASGGSGRISMFASLWAYAVSPLDGRILGVSGRVSMADGRPTGPTS